MAKKALFDVLERTIGKYVLNLDAASLNVAIWSGQIELNGLELDVRAVNDEISRRAEETPNLALPFRVTSGQFTSFQVDVPWANLTSKPVVLRAQGLKVSLEPFDHVAAADLVHSEHENEELRACLIESQRESSLNIAEENRQQTMALRKLAEQDLEDDPSKGKSSFGTRLVRRIIENIQIEIQDVQLSLEGAGFSAGIILEFFQLVTTDMHGNRSFVDRTAGKDKDSSFLYKALLIQGLGIYMDEDKPRHHMPSIGEDEVAPQKQHSFLVSPLSFEAKLRQADATTCRDYPKYMLESEVQALSILFSQAQLVLIRNIGHQIRAPREHLIPLFPEYRPLHRPRGSAARAWWHYAYRCITRLTGKRSWIQFYEAYRQRQRYISLYKRDTFAASCPWIQSLISDEKVELRRIEQDRTITVDGIMTWRTIATAQVEKERSKFEATTMGASRPGGSVFASLFGTTGNVANSDQASPDPPPVSLSPEEVKQLETIAFDQAAEAELSSDSRLCDLKFVLGSLETRLIAHDSRPLGSLEMGTVSADFCANVDGFYAFDFSMSSLMISDQVTLHSLFPKVLQNRNLSGAKENAFHAHLSRTRTGDQVVRLRLSTFEITASPKLALGISRFFGEEKDASMQQVIARNPILAQSMSGSVDIFYDANEGSHLTPANAEPFHGTVVDRVSSGGFDPSHTLFNAWKSKTENKTAWMIDLDVQAPIVIVPENCTDPNANVLIFNLGWFHFCYGSTNEEVDSAKKVLKWLEENPRTTTQAAVELGLLRIQNLTFTVDKVSRLSDLLSIADPPSSGLSTVYEPMSLEMAFVLETAESEEVPRFCLFGVIPTIVLKISPVQLSGIFSVLKLWKSLHKEISSDLAADTTTEQKDQGDLVTDALSFQSERPKDIAFPDLHLSHNSTASSTIYVDFILQRLSVKLDLDDQGHGIEGNLVSVSASFASMSNARSQAKLTIGWFWIIDLLEYDFPRRNRILVHSKLPLNRHSRAEQDYDIMQELDALGAFGSDFQGSSELADIRIQRGSDHTVDASRPGNSSSENSAVDTAIEARFTTLNINWNPQAVKQMVVMAEHVWTFSDTTNFQGHIILSDPVEHWNTHTTMQQKNMKDQEKSKAEWKITASMESFTISLNSARDDLPLFLVNMLATEFSSIYCGDVSRFSCKIDNFTLATPETGKTLSTYRTMLGLVPGHEESLVSVEYYNGQELMSSKASFSGIDITECESYAFIKLSPMRLVYIHAQVMAFVEYATEGILGALTASAVSSAAQAAVELATSKARQKIFHIETTGLDICIPQAAYSNVSISIMTRDGSVDYCILPAPGGSHARIALSGVAIQDSSSFRMLQKDVKINMGVLLPPIGFGNVEEEALKVDLTISEATFMLSKSQYQQLLLTLVDNIGEQDLFLRDSGLISEPSMEPRTTYTSPEMDMGLLTHAGAAVIDVMRRIYIEIHLNELTLLLVLADETEPLVRVSAVKGKILLSFLGDLGIMKAEATLKDLACTDERIESLGRQERSLVYQGTSKTVQDVFYVSYESQADTSKHIKLSIGSPHLILVPDAISDVSNFFNNGPSPVSTDPRSDAMTKLKDVPEFGSYGAAIEPSGDDVEAELVRVSQRQVSVTTIEIKTDCCSLLLVDLGSRSLLPTPGSRLSVSVSSSAEYIVIEGFVDGEVTLRNDTSSGDIESIDAELHASTLEIYSAYGSSLSSPIQILEPVQISLYMSMKPEESESSSIDIRCVTATPLDVIVSMRNIALIGAISSSLTDCLQESAANDRMADGTSYISEQTALTEMFGSSPMFEAVLSTDELTSAVNVYESSALAGDDIPNHKVHNWKRIVSMKLTISEASVTIINDLQGIDEAIMRVSAHNLIGGARMDESQRLTGTSCHYTGFQFTLHTSILADYFDASANMWKHLLGMPWEIACNASRGNSSRFSSQRPSTTVELESFPLYMSFSEQFLMAIASANYMWQIYSKAIESAVDSKAGNAVDWRMHKSIATSAARALIKSLPYAVENHSGLDLEFFVQNKKENRRLVACGTVEYFKFEPPRGFGRGGKRTYGQEVSNEKSLTLLLGEDSVELKKVDEQLSLASRAIELGGRLLICTIMREGKTTVFHLSSGVDIINLTFLRFAVAIRVGDEDKEIGVCLSKPERESCMSSMPEVSGFQDCNVSKPSSLFGVPADCLKGHRLEWTKKGRGLLMLVVRPVTENGQRLAGTINLSCEGASLHPLEITTVEQDVICRPSPEMVHDAMPSSFEFRVSTVTRRINGFLCLEITLKPKASLYNKIPVAVSVRTPMPHTYAKSGWGMKDSKYVTHELGQNEVLQIFTPGPSIAVTVKCKDIAIAGSSTDWMEGWVDLPLISSFRLPEPLVCFFPLSRRVADPLGMKSSLGSQFIISEVEEITPKSNDSPSPSRIKHQKGLAAASPARQTIALSQHADINFFLAVHNYSVDHTGNILFEQIPSPAGSQFRRSISSVATPVERRSQVVRPMSAPLGAFSTERGRHRISLLPESHVPIRILQLTMEGDEGLRKGSPFCVEDIAICEGGVMSTPLNWEDGRSSGYYAYRRLVDSHQSEVHIIPEYVIFNGSRNQQVLIKQPSGPEIEVAPGKIAALAVKSDGAAAISIEYIFGAWTPLVRIDSLGLRIAVVKSRQGDPIGSVAIQTVVGSRDSRIVVKLGEIKHGSTNVVTPTSAVMPLSLENDFIRFRLQCSEIRVTLEKASPAVDQTHAFRESALDRLKKTISPSFSRQGKPSEQVDWKDTRSQIENTTSADESVCTVLIHRVTVDWQRVFKEEETFYSTERSQLSIIIHNVQLRDETLDTEYPIVFNSTSNVSFLDLCVRFRGPVSAEFVKIDLFDLNLAHSNGRSQPIVINTSEAFIWKLLDVANRIMLAATDIIGVAIELRWDSEHGGYSVSISDKKHTLYDEEEKYVPPKSDVLYDISLARVSPFVMEVSFKRIPQSSRYKLMAGFRGANIMNYFTTRLKFKIDQAELNFSRYETRNIRGPLDHLFEMLTTVYLSRMKLKLVSIMTAASFQDWKKLAAREEGDDEFVEGDILRVAGNIAGNSANYILKKAGMGLGHGISTVSHALGDGIENATSAIGVGAVGAGVNSVVSGVGEGVGNALTGVGTGAGSVVKGVGKGVGQVFGGLSGGVMLVGKGIGKGLTEGDGKAVASGFAEGATSVGLGVGQGIESLVHGTASGVQAVGSGLFSGVKSIGQGIGGAFSGKTQQRKSPYGDKRR